MAVILDFAVIGDPIVDISMALLSLITKSDIVAGKNSFCLTMYFLFLGLKLFVLVFFLICIIAFRLSSVYLLSIFVKLFPFLKKYGI